MPRCRRNSMKKLAANVLVAASMLGISATSLAANESPEGPVGVIQQGLVGGGPVDAATQEKLGLLSLSRPGGSCSASLLRNNWAITAAHCVEMKDAAGNVTG